MHARDLQEVDIGTPIGTYDSSSETFIRQEVDPLFIHHMHGTGKQPG